jgi:hypothetical protein
MNRNQTNMISGSIASNAVCAWRFFYFSFFSIAKGAGNAMV